MQTFKSVLQLGLIKLKTTGFFHVFGSSVINKIMGFLSGVILVRVISKADYGIYTYANNILSFFLLAKGLGMNSSSLQLCSETTQEDRRRMYYQYGCRTGFLFNCLLCAGVLACARFVPLRVEGANRLLLTMCLLPLVSFLPEMQQTNLRASLRNKEFGISNTFFTAVTVLLSCALAFLWKVYGLVAAHYLAPLLTSLLLAHAFGLPFSLRAPAMEKETRRLMLGIGFISMLSCGMAQLMYLLDVFVLGLVVPDNTVIASYKVATTIPAALSFIPSSVMIYIYPYFARHKEDKHWLMSSYRKLTLIMGGINLCISAGLFLLAPYILTIVFGAQYLDALVPFRILCISYAFSGTLRDIVGNLLAAQRRLQFNLGMAIAGGLINTLLNVLMIRQWGSPGAAIATLLTTVFLGGISSLYLLRVYHSLPEETKPQCEVPENH